MAWRKVDKKVDRKVTEGRQEGKQEAKLEAIPRLLALGLSVEQVAVALDLTVAQVQQVAQNQSG